MNPFLNLSPDEIPDAYRVVDGLLAGEYPGSVDDDVARAKVRWLQDAGVLCFLDLTEAGEHSLKPYAHFIAPEDNGATVEYVRMPIRDLSAPTRAQMGETLDFIDGQLAQGRSVYVHCWGGVGRTGTVVGCYLARHGIANGSVLMAKIAELRSGTRKRRKDSPEMPSQVRLIESWRVGE